MCVRMWVRVIFKNLFIPASYISMKCSGFETEKSEHIITSTLTENLQVAYRSRDRSNSVVSCILNQAGTGAI